MRSFKNATLNSHSDRLGNVQNRLADAIDHVINRIECDLIEIRSLAALVDEAGKPADVSSAGFRALTRIDQVQSYLARDGRRLAEEVAIFSYEQGKHAGVNSTCVKEPAAK
jgi:hypothetical protein